MRKLKIGKKGKEFTLIFGESYTYPDLEKVYTEKVLEAFIKAIEDYEKAENNKEEE